MPSLPWRLYKSRELGINRGKKEDPEGGRRGRGGGRKRREGKEWGREGGRETEIGMKTPEEKKRARRGSQPGQGQLRPRPGRTEPEVRESRTQEQGPAGRQAEMGKRL